MAKSIYFTAFCGRPINAHNNFCTITTFNAWYLSKFCLSFKSICNVYFCTRSCSQRVILVHTVNSFLRKKGRRICISKYAQDGIEKLRYIRNTKPTTFLAQEGIYCMNEDDSLATGSCTEVNIANTFKREAEFTQIPSVECGNSTKVVVSVYWSTAKCGKVNTFCHKSQLVSCFVNQAGSSSSL